MPETLDRFEKQFDRLFENIRDFTREQKELEEKQKQAKQELKALMLRSDAPTISELEGVRSERNRGWNLIKRKYIEKIDINKETIDLVSDSDLPAFYEQKVDMADNVSDQLRLAADQVAKRADLEAGIENLESRRGDIMKELGKAHEEKETYQKQWVLNWKPFKIDSGSPGEMKQWLVRVEKLMAKVQTANTVYAEVKMLSADREVARKSIAPLISKFDDSLELEEMNLETMINLCEQRIEREEAILARKRQLEHSLDNTKLDVKRARAELSTIESDKANWAQEWAMAIDGLGLKPDTHPEQASEAFNQLLGFFDKFDKSEDLRKRIYGIDQVAEKFKKKVFEFASRIGFKKDGQEAVTITAQLNRNLNEAREARASHKKIEARIKEIKEEIADTDITIRTAQEQLAALKAQAGVATDDELKSACDSSLKKQESLRELDRLERELSRGGDGLSVQELEKEAGESDIDAIEGELENIVSELNEMETNRDRYRDLRQTQQNEIQAMDGKAAAANASEEAEQQLATMISGAEQYLRLQIAACVLKQRIEIYRKKNQAPVLARAGKLFSRLTLGSYMNLRDELDANGKPILLGVRPSQVEVPVDGMSDGTRDQLYLSLRLATLEQHLSSGEPIPFIVDDILTGFDDNRTRVCLEILAELALGTQVLLFTHHRRVLELADELKTKAGIFNHELH